MHFNIECKQEDGRWIAKVDGLPGVLAYGDSSDKAIVKAESLALRALADKLEQGGSLYESLLFYVVLKEKKKTDNDKFPDLSYWNYRVVRKYHLDSEITSYEVYEVYYRKDGGAECWTKLPVKPYGDTLVELREDIRLFLQAFRRPVLNEKEVDGKQILTQDDQDDPINDGHYFEFMDRASVAVDYIYQFLGSHPLLRKESQLREIYLKAEQTLADLYQEAGRLELEQSQTNK